MSGGSWGYLHCKDAQDLVWSDDNLIRMSEALTSLGYAEDAARETYELVQIIRQYKTRVDVITERLSSVWEYMEKWDSGDTGEEGVRLALERYRGEEQKEDVAASEQHLIETIERLAEKNKKRIEEERVIERKNSGVEFNDVQKCSLCGVHFNGHEIDFNVVLFQEITAKETDFPSVSKYIEPEKRVWVPKEVYNINCVCPDCFKEKMMPFIKGEEKI